jgi:hypothetical protein
MKKVARKNSRLGLGWMPDLPDNRDHLYSAPLAKLRVLPTKADLRRRCPKVYNQGQIGSCTANAIAAAVEFDRKKQNCATLSRHVSSFIITNEALSTACRSITARRFVTE